VNPRDNNRFNRDPRKLADEAVEKIVRELAAIRREATAAKQKVPRRDRPRQFVKWYLLRLLRSFQSE
jgi:hypothetical protein